ncbi:MAG: DUF6580 family putative transport protein [Bacteroidales bacterium]
MKKQIFTPMNLTIVGMVVLAAMARFMPHPPAFSPIAAMAIFGGAYFAKKSWALVLPLVVMLATDAYFGYYPEMWGVYIPFIIAGCLGFLLRKKVTVLRVGGICLSSSLIFFLISNFAVWLGGLCAYPMNFSGLITCYAMGLPFFRNEVLGTLVYSGVMFGAFELAKLYLPSLSPNKVK